MCSTQQDRKSFTLLLPIYFSTVTNEVNHDHSFIMQDLVYDAVITYAKPEKACQVSLERCRLDIIQILGQPVNALHNTLVDLLILAVPVRE